MSLREAGPKRTLCYPSDVSVRCLLSMGEGGGGVKIQGYIYPWDARKKANRRPIYFASYATAVGAQEDYKRVLWCQGNTVPQGLCCCTVP